MNRAFGARNIKALVLCAVGAVGISSLSGGCALGMLVGGMAESYKESSTKTVEAKYTGIQGKTFAVIVAADRSIQADYPRVIADLTVTISERLKEFCGASGYVPGQAVLKFQYDTPRWVAMSAQDIAEELGVVRLVYIDLQEFRLNDPGNSYLWNGIASATVGVIETENSFGGTFAMLEPVRVSFPDKEGMGPMQLPVDTVALALSKRFVDRASWLFYAHQEPYYPEY